VGKNATQNRDTRGDSCLLRNNRHQSQEPSAKESTQTPGKGKMKNPASDAVLKKKKEGATTAGAIGKKKKNPKGRRAP